MTVLAVLLTLSCSIQGLWTRVAPPRSEYVFTRDDNNFIFVTGSKMRWPIPIAYDPTTRYDHVALSPDKKKLVAVEPSWRMWLFNLETGTKTCIGSQLAAAGIGGVDWGSDSETLYFSGFGDGNAEIYSYNIRSQVLEQLTSTPDLNETDVSISDDGSLLSFAAAVVGVEGMKNDIWVSFADGSGARQVFSAPEYGELGSSGLPLGGYDPELSPDNQWVVFNFGRNDNGDNFGWGSSDILLVQIHSGLTLTLFSNGGLNFVPDWGVNGVVWTEVNEKDQYRGSRFWGTDEGGSRRVLPHSKFIKLTN